MAAPVIGLAPTSPLMMPPPVVVTAAPARIVNWAADPKLTGAGPAATNVPGGASKATASTRPMSIRLVPSILSVRGACAGIEPIALLLRGIIIDFFFSVKRAQARQHAWRRESIFRCS